jgi:carbonic anhydrase/acetyltransferase-like protein (isoleucine patch superfamily)
VLGIPGKVIKEVSPEMHESFKTNAEMYVELGKKHKLESERSKQTK